VERHLPIFYKFILEAFRDTSRNDIFCNGIFVPFPLIVCFVLLYHFILIYPLLPGVFQLQTTFFVEQTNEKTLRVRPCLLKF
jgi:hypothetical protein